MKRILAYALFLSLSFTAHAFAATTAAASGDNLLVVNGSFPMQGDCTINGAPHSVGGKDEIDPTVSLWSCPGLSDTPLSFNFTGGNQESCLYIDNLTNQNTFFVPLRTFNEWDKFRRATLPGSEGTLDGKVKITYGCLAETIQNTCGGTASLPVARDGAQKTITKQGKHVTYACIAPNGCGSWTVVDAQGQCPVDGICGASNGASLASAPTTDFCVAGTFASFVGNGPWSWSCTGTDGGTTASCSADIKPATCTPTSKPINIVIVLNSSGSMADLVVAARAALQSIADTYLANKPNITLTITMLGNSLFNSGASGASPLSGGLSLLGNLNAANGLSGLLGGLAGTCPYGHVLGPGPANSAAIAAALNQINTDSNTPLADALVFSSQYVENTPNPAVILLSDGVETCNGDVAAAVQTVKGKGIKLFGIAYGAYEVSTFSGFDSYASADTNQEVLSALQKYIGQAVCGGDVESTSPPAPTPPPYTPSQGDPVVPEGNGGN